MKGSLFMMKLQSLATVTGASSAGVTNDFFFFFVDAEFKAELPSRLFKSFESGNGSRISDEKLVILEFKYLQNKKW